MKLHKSITLKRIMRACEAQSNTLENPGFCLACGHKQGECEPDAREYECEKCGARKVYGAEEILMMIG